MVPLAKAFLARGDEVAWAAAAPLAPRLEPEGFTVLPAGLPADRSMAEFFERFPEIHDLPGPAKPPFMFPRLFGAVHAGPMLDDLLPAARTWGPSLIVHDAAELAAPIVAAILGVPNAVHSFGDLVPPERIEGAAAYLADRWEANGLTPRPYGGCYEHAYLDIYPSSLQPVEMSHVPVIRKLRPGTFATAGEEAPSWVTEPGDPLVYVTLGTVFNRDITLLTTIVAALGTLPVRVVATVGPGGDPSALGPQPDNIHATRYISQTALLPHVALVVSHAGSGTFLAALSHGLPQLCVPQAADQFRNTDAAVTIGAALAFPPGGATVDGVRDAVSRLLGDPSFAEAAAALATEIRAMPPPEAVADWLAALP